MSEIINKRQRTIRELPKEPFYYKHRNFFAGLFLLLPLLFLIGTAIVTIIKSEILEDWTIVHIKTESGAGLLPGRTPVQIMGMDVGRIHKVDINSQGYVDVALKVKTKYSALLSTNSTARLMQKNIVVGDWLIDLSVGSNAYLPVQDGDTLEVAYSVRLDELMNLFTNFMDPLKSIVQSLNEGEGLIKYFLGSDTLVDGLVELVSGADQLIVNADLLMKQAQGTVVKADRMIGEFSRFGSNGISVVDTLMLFARHADKMVTDLNNTVFAMDSMVANLDSIPEDFRDAMLKLDAELDEMGIVFRALEDHFLLRRPIKRYYRKTSPDYNGRSGE